MERRDGEPAAAKRAKQLSADAGGGGGGGRDYLSALPDDLLIQVLLKLRSVALAARTSVLSSRWRRLWALLPELDFSNVWDSSGVLPALSAHEARVVLRRLNVVVFTASTESEAAWLPVAASRLSGDLTFTELGRRGEGVFELPCFEKATSITLKLEWMSLALPSSGVFARVTNILLEGIQLHDQCLLGETLSSPQFPVLQKLTICLVRGLHNFTIYSESLLQLELSGLFEMQQLTIVAPALEELSVNTCFNYLTTPSQPIANISVPRLVMLRWCDAYDPASTKFGEMPHLRSLYKCIFSVYALDDSTNNDNSLRLLRRFMAVHHLNLVLVYELDLGDRRYSMEDMTSLPGITFLSLDMMANGHSFGASGFHVLRLCTSLRKLALKYSEKYNACQTGCVCDETPDWKTEELVLDRLQEVEISELTGTEHQVTFLERIFSWATMLKKMTIFFDYRITESKAKELSPLLRRFSRPDICMEFYVCRGNPKKVYVPED